MPNDLNISSVSASSPAPTDAFLKLDPTTDTATTAGSTTAASTKTAAAASTALFANPTLQINANLGIVVIEFRDASGAVTSQIPSERQINAYIAGSASVPNLDSEPAPTPAKPLSTAVGSSESAKSVDSDS